MSSKSFFVIGVSIRIAIRLQHKPLHFSQVIIFYKILAGKNKVAPPGFEPRSQGFFSEAEPAKQPKPWMIDRYTTGRSVVLSDLGCLKMFMFRSRLW